MPSASSCTRSHRQAINDDAAVMIPKPCHRAIWVVPRILRPHGDSNFLDHDVRFVVDSCSSGVVPPHFRITCEIIKPFLSVIGWDSPSNQSEAWVIWMSYPILLVSPAAWSTLLKAYIWTKQSSPFDTDLSTLAGVGRAG